MAKHKKTKIKYISIAAFDDQIISQSRKEVNYEKPEWRSLKNGLFLWGDILGGKRNTTHINTCVKYKIMTKKVGRLHF